MKKTNKKGFTIVELVIVIAVIAILAGVLIPTFSGVVKKANESKRLQLARNAFSAVLLANDGQLDETKWCVEITDGDITYHFVLDKGVLTPKGTTCVIAAESATIEHVEYTNESEGYGDIPQGVKAVYAKTKQQES